MQPSTIFLLYGVFALTFMIIIALFMEKTKGKSFGTIKLGWGIAVTVFCFFQFIVLYLYFTDYFFKVDVELAVFLTGWFICSVVGCVVSFLLFIRRQLLVLAVVILLMSYLMLGLGEMMRYFNTM